VNVKLARGQARHQRPLHRSAIEFGLMFDIVVQSHTAARSLGSIHGLISPRNEFVAQCRFVTIRRRDPDAWGYEHVAIADRQRRRKSLADLRCNMTTILGPVETAADHNKFVTAVAPDDVVGPDDLSKLRRKLLQKFITSSVTHRVID